MGKMDPEIRKVEFTCGKCDRTLFVIHNMIVPVYFQMEVICPSCQIKLDGEDVKIYRSAPDYKLQHRLNDPEDLI
jgi:C4-type Zn-finger protein